MWRQVALRGAAKFASGLRFGAKRLWKASFSQKYLVYTNIATGGVLFAVGDWIEQELEKSQGWVDRDREYDSVRTGRMFLVGLVGGPPHHYWYTWLDKRLPERNVRTVARKILADQLFAAPLFAFILFFGVGLLQGKDWSGCWEEFKKKFPTVYMFDWLIWPPTQFVNFLLVPAAYRVLYINLITVVWDVFLSYMKHYDELSDGKKD